MSQSETPADREIRKEEARKYLDGEYVLFEDAHKLWKQLKNDDEISLARSVIARLRSNDKHLRDKVPFDKEDKLCQQHAELTSKDPELSASVRHDMALEILGEKFKLDDPKLNGNVETLGIAGGICKRRWMDLGQYEDLRRAADYYTRGAEGPVGDDGYAHINAAFLQDLLAHASGADVNGREVASTLREKILQNLTPLDKVADDCRWWNAATRAEALFGLGIYKKAAAAIAAVTQRPVPWELQTTAQQLATLAHLREDRPFDNPEIRAVFEALLHGAAETARSALIGKVGLALSGGGFRASFYHLGVLARLAELDVLRHVDVLSCVSGGSIVGACYWLMLRNRLLARDPSKDLNYIALVQDLIEHFVQAVRKNLRGLVQPTKIEAIWRFLTGKRGVIDTEKIAEALERDFYAPLWKEDKPLDMHHLPFTPKDHDPFLARSQQFHPGKHNWLRKYRVPVLVLNATTVNTGHSWQFTPTWMGESPWSIYPAADSVPRLQWHWYEPEAGWQMSLARAVAASACVPGLFEPLRIDDAYDGYQIRLVDGGVHDNQGTVALLAHNCNLLLVNDAAGQLLFETAPKPGVTGLGAYAGRVMTTLMERIRLANYGDLSARVRTKLIRGLMFLHMKDGLDADPIRLKFSQDSYTTKRTPLSPLGVRKDFQQAAAELRTDLDVFSDDEAYVLMACGYRMAAKAFERDLRDFTELYRQPVPGQWPFAEMLDEVKSTEAATHRRKKVLDALHGGRKRKI